MNEIKLSDWYTAPEAAKAMSKRLHRVVKPAYLRSLARLDKVRTHKVGAHTTLYNKADVDAYVVEDRGVKVARANKARATKREEAIA